MKNINLTVFLSTTLSTAILFSSPLYADNVPWQQPDTFSFNSLLLATDNSTRFPLPEPKPAPYVSELDYTIVTEFDEVGEIAQEKKVKKGPLRLNGDGHLIMSNDKNGENLDVYYRNDKGEYSAEAFVKIKHFFRSLRDDAELDMNPELIEILDSLQEKFGNRTINLLSGYRSPEVNRRLRKISKGVAEHSLHIKGLASDINIPGVPLHELRDAALSLQAQDTGGVGYYPTNGFVHVDTGEVRQWQSVAKAHKYKKFIKGKAQKSKRGRHAK